MSTPAGPEARADASRRRARRLVRLLGPDRVGIFVPAVMSVGLLFWIVSESMEVLRLRARDAGERRTQVAASAVADQVLGRRPAAVAGLRPRGVYLMVSLMLLGGAVYVWIGSLYNFLHPGGYLYGVAWVFALATGTVVVAVFYGAAALLAFSRWPTPPDWVRGMLLRSRLGAVPMTEAELAGRPPWQLTAAVVWVIGLIAVVVGLVTWSPEVVESFNRGVADWLAAHDLLSPLAVMDPLQRTGVAIAVAMLAALAGARCRVVALSCVASVGGVLVVSAVLRPLVAQVRPGRSLSDLTSFPSVPVAFMVVVAGLVPLALAVLFERTWIIRWLRLTLGVAVLATAADRVVQGTDLAIDVVGGALIGLLFVLMSQWGVANLESHSSCDHCPWSTEPYAGTVLGAIPIHVDRRHALRLLARITASVAAMGLAVVTFAVDIPEDVVGYGFGSSIQQAVQLSIALLISVAALVSWKWQGAGAVMVALAAVAGGVFAAVEFGQLVAVLMTAALMVPAVLLWLSWQHARRPHEIVALAVVTCLLTGATWVGAAAAYDRVYGPTHPDSAAVDIAVDRVEWVWSGGLTAHGVTVTAQLLNELDGVGSAQLSLVPVGGGPAVLTDSVDPDADRLVRFPVDGLRPGTAYRYRVVVDGTPDDGRGFGAFRTPEEGPYSFTVTAGGCARTASNGAVYDAIAAVGPVLNIVSGDLHYSNVESTAPSDFIAAYNRTLTTPAQAALARAVPMAYVWDDHDYGPNDAGATTPGRSAVREAYRRAVPHYPVTEGDAPINQAFTIGRVRFVVTDLRSEHLDDTVLGEEQLGWLLDELTTASRTHAAVVWVSSIPWIGTESPGSDSWFGAPQERRVIADTIADHGIRNLVMVSGDAHMVAIDDGTHSDYSTSGAGGFPVLAAAALDRPGSVKGGPYSDGMFPGGGQFGVLDVVDDGGDSITIGLSGRTWEGATLVEREVSFAVPPGARVP
ncbi:MAG TPA: alkaline phosphatase D family protein [Ornithinibacter sp.]|nr:alkaline phosphatase D family protein [Ornithinibacter sp.]